MLSEITLSRQLKNTRNSGYIAESHKIKDRNGGLSGEIMYDPRRAGKQRPIEAAI